MAFYRTLDPGIGRWMQVDPKAESFYHMSPYAAMGNNPVSIVDPAGDEIFTAMAVGSIFGVIGNGITNVLNNQPFFQNWAQAAVTGAVGGALSGGALSMGAGMLRAGSSVASSYLPSLDFSIGSLNFSISPSFVFGGANGAWNLGANATISGAIGEFPFAFGGGIGYGKDYHSTFTGWNKRGFAAAGHGNFMLSSSYYKAACLPGQRIGGLHFNDGTFSLSYENDGFPFSGWTGDGGDSYRSASLRVGYGDFDAGFNIFTGYRNYKLDNKIATDEYPFGTVGGGANNFLVSNAYIGYKGWRAGFNDWHVGDLFQNRIAHSIKKQAWFGWGNHKNSSNMHQYSGFFSRNPFTNW